MQMTSNDILASIFIIISFPVFPFFLSVFHVPPRTSAQTVKRIQLKVFRAPNSLYLDAYQDSFSHFVTPRQPF